MKESSKDIDDLDKIVDNLPSEEELMEHYVQSLCEDLSRKFNEHMRLKKSFYKNFYKSDDELKKELEEERNKNTDSIYEEETL